MISVKQIRKTFFLKGFLENYLKTCILSFDDPLKKTWEIFIFAYLNICSYLNKYILPIRHLNYRI